MTTKINSKDIRFAIVRRLNDAKKVILDGEIEVDYQPKAWIGGDYGWADCTNYGTHFTFLDPVKPVSGSPEKRWFAMCSCGAPSILVGSNQYKHLVTAAGWRLVCYN